MNRLVMVVSSSDDCTWSQRDVIPVLGESVEALFVEYHDLKALSGKALFDFKGVEFNDSYTDDPEFLTLDEWYRHAV